MKIFIPEDLIKNIEEVEQIKKLPFDYLQEKSVPGIDLYGYGKYPLIEQIYVPVIFNKLFESTASDVSEKEQFLFGSYSKDLCEYKSNFISTGDGGFQIFDNPLQATVFAIYIQSNVKRLFPEAALLIF